MVARTYKWKEGVELEPHTQKKHQILREYFRSYLLTRCQFPTTSFKLIVVDGFSGSGLYEGGHTGSSLLFVEVLIEVIVKINIERDAKGWRPLSISCLLCLNDNDFEVTQELKQNIAEPLRQCREIEHLSIETQFYSQPFEELYWELKPKLKAVGCNNVFFNLDQCGYIHVSTTILRDIIASWKSAEILLTFMIQSLITYLSPTKNNVTLEPELRQSIQRLSIEFEKGQFGKTAWLGAAEKAVFEYLGQAAPFVSPFSINNNKGWRYWLMHFASSYRARQVFNNVLHSDFSTQAHFGRAGLKMLSYTPGDDVQLYLFNSDSREVAKKELYEDIPRMISESGDTLEMDEFYKLAYNETAAHSDDIHEMMILNPDVEVLTGSEGGMRRKANTIKVTDRLRLNKQQNLFFFYEKKNEK